MSRKRPDPADQPVEDAIERWLNRKEGAKAAATVDEYGYRLARFAEWVETTDIETVGDLHPMDFGDYLSWREAKGVAPLTMQKHFGTIGEWIEFLESLGAVEDGLHEAVPDISVDQQDTIDETILHPEDGDALVAFYRDSTGRYGTREHALLELIWFIGCRLGAVRGLDLRDFDRDDQSLTFVHRPDSHTPLKKRRNGEREVALSAATTDVVASYVDQYRHNSRDDAGRAPLFTTATGRPSPDTLRTWSYVATEPCVRTDCPHDKDRATCEWTDYNNASKCPSSRSPNQVRSGAITRMLNRIPRDRVRHRAKTSQWEHYDQATERERMEHRDREIVDDIELDPSTEE